MLPRDNNERVKQQQQSSEGIESPYLVDAYSHFDKTTGMSSLTSLSRERYQAQVKINGDSATITGLIDLSGFENVEQIPIGGHYDSETHTITINTPSQVKPSNYLKCAEFTNEGQTIECMLLSGFMDVDENGQTVVFTSDKMVLDVSPDSTTLTPEGGFFGYAYTATSYKPLGFVDFIKNATLHQLLSVPNLKASTDTIDFEGPEWVPGHIGKASFTIVNYSTQAANISSEVSGEGFSIAAPSKIDVAGEAVCTISFKAETPGKKQGSVILQTENGSEVKIALSATVNEPSDYSSIVKKGNITFNTTEDFPFVITDTISGCPYPVALSTNNGDSTFSSLDLTVTVPDSQVGTLRWKGVSQSSQPNGVVIYVDGSPIFDDTFSWKEGQGKHPANGITALSGGAHHVVFRNVIALDWHAKGWTEAPLRAWFWDLEADCFNNADYAALSTTDSVTFADRYFDKASLTDTATASLLNVGKQPLKVISTDGDGIFNAVIDNAEAAQMNELPVKIVYQVAQAGNYYGQVVLHTTAGDFTILCHIDIIELPYDYSSIVDEGDFSFETSIEHPFYVGNGTAYNSTSGENKQSHSWLTATFEVPEEMTGQLSWNGHNSSADLADFLGYTILYDGTTVSLDNETKVFGGDCEMGSAQFCADGSQTILLLPGKHTLTFDYQKKNLTPSRDDKATVSHLSLKLDSANGISLPTGNACLPQIYTTEGVRVKQPVQGVNIIRYRLSDGRVVTRKIFRNY